MATVAYLSGKSWFSKIADILQRREAGFAKSFNMSHSVNAEAIQSVENVANTSKPTDATTRTKLNVSLDDLKVISTALLQYSRNLAKQGEQEKSAQAAHLDRQFYHMITALEAKAKQALAEEKNIDYAHAA